MIYCLTKKPEAYIANTPFGVNGLFHHYGNDPYLFSLLSRTCSAFFMYEQGFEDVEEVHRFAEFDRIELWKNSLDFELAGVPVKTALEQLQPRQLTELFWDNMPEEFPLCQLFPPDKKTGLKAGGVWFNMYLRTLQHEKYYRGKLMDGSGKVVGAAFSSRLSKDEDAFLENQKSVLKAGMKEVINAKRVS